MTLAALLKLFHILSAFASIAGFGLRAYWMAAENPLLHHRLTKVLPHVIDTILLASAIGLLVILQLSPLAHAWLTAKIVALLVYIALGMVALRLGRSKTTRVCAGLLALLTAAYIVAVACSKNPWGFLPLQI